MNQLLQDAFNRAADLPYTPQPADFTNQAYRPKQDGLDYHVEFATLEYSHSNQEREE